MTETQKIIIIVGEHKIDAYQTESEEILLTRRQIGEVIGKTKATAQRFLKQNEAELPLSIQAKIPERHGKIPLAPWLSAHAYWVDEAKKGNHQAQDLIDAIGSLSVNDLEIKVLSDLNVSESQEDFNISENKGDLSIIAKGIEISAQWMLDSGIDTKAVCAWKLSQLAIKVPELAGIVASAQELIGIHTSTPTGMITSQLAKKLSSILETKITPTKTNQALHDLGLQDWAKPGVNRERKLTEHGKQYGVALLTTSSEGWQGAQIRWFDSVIPVLTDYFQKQVEKFYPANGEEMDFS